jgi:hypothetical protein
MPQRPVDPASLEGEALTRWYLRTPDEIEAERNTGQEQRYREFFGGLQTGGDNQRHTLSAPELDPDVLWVANGSGGYRAVRPRGSNSLTAPEPNPQATHPHFLPAVVAESEGGEFLEIGNPENQRLKREHIKKEGYWPKTADGRDYDVSHRRAIADGGSNTLDNIEPMDPDDHRAKHKRDGDAARWGKRAAIARAFGGRVEPPRPRPMVRGLGPLNSATGLTGILSGRIRTDNFDNFVSDMLGFPSNEDYDRESERRHRMRNPNWKPGDPITI